MATTRQTFGAARAMAGLRRRQPAGAGGTRPGTIPVLRKVGDIAFFAFLEYSALARGPRILAAVEEGKLLEAVAHIGSGIMMFLMAVLFLIRRPVVGQRASWTEVLVAFVGSYAIVPLVWLPMTWEADGVLVVSTVASIIGAIGVCYALRSLGRSFAVLPEARALVTSGPYRWVRHPIYTLHIVTLFGTMLPRIGPAAIALLALGVFGECLRAGNEERALRRAFPEYEAYQKRSWRFIPWVY